MKLHLPKTLLAAVLALAPCAAGATTYGWDSGTPTTSTDGSAATAIDYTTTANAIGGVTATGPTSYTQTGAITSLSAAGYDVKLQLDGSGLSGIVTADSLWLTGDKVFTAGTGTGQAQITTNALYLVGSQMRLTSASPSALENVGDIFIGWTSVIQIGTDGIAAAKNAAIYATDTTEITQNIMVVDSTATNAGGGAKITIHNNKTLTLSGNIDAEGKTLVVTGYDGSGTLELRGTNDIGSFYLSGSPSKYDGPGYGVKLVLSEGTTTIDTLNAIKVSGNENSICIKDKAELILTSGIQANTQGSGTGDSLLAVEEGGKLTFTSGFSGELNSHLSLRGSGMVSNAGTLSISGSVNLSKAIENTGTITFKNGAVIDLSGYTATKDTLDTSRTELQTLATTYTLVKNDGAGASVDIASDATVTFNLSGQAQANLTWTGDKTAVYSEEKVYNIAVGGSAGYGDVKTAFGTDTGYINVLGTLTELNENPAYAVKGNGIVEITADITEPSNLNEFAGTIRIRSGQLTLNTSPEKIAAAAQVEVYSGGTLQSWSKPVDTKVVLDGGKLLCGLSSDWRGEIEIKSDSEISAPPADASRSATISGNITGDGAITKTGKGILKTTGSLSLAKALTVSDGTMEVAGETTFESGYSKEGTGKLKITGHATVSENATVKLNETTLAESTATFSGKGAVENAGTTTASVTLKDDFKGELSASAGALSAQWENAASTGKSLALASATGGDLTITSVGDGITITDIVIGAGRTVGVYTGDTTSSSSRISLQGNLTAGEGSVLEAGLSTMSGSSLTLNSFLDLGGNNLFILNTRLSGDVLNWTNGDSITLFTNVGSWGGSDLGALDSLDDISWIFSNVGEWDNQYNYTLSSGTDGSVILNRTATPEPTTATLSLLALVGLCARRRRK